MPALLWGWVMRRVRSAIYTRKSSEDGLDQDFNSLDAQREACEACIASQRHEGWELNPEHYDDGGISGGHMDRPALQRLMQVADAKRIDQIVVYKIERLTRLLADFAKLVDRLDAAEASFVSVTQSFNTATSIGRLALNILLSFAQFEREVMSERIRDKIAASKRQGMWMGGLVPLGYQEAGRTLVIDEVEAETVRTLYSLYLDLGTVREVKERAAELGLRTRRRQRSSGKVGGGTTFDRGHLLHIPSNPIYAGMIRHKGQVFDGQHPAIIDPDVWDKVQEQRQSKACIAHYSSRKKSSSMRCSSKTFRTLTPTPPSIIKSTRLCPSIVITLALTVLRYSNAFGEKREVVTKTPLCADTPASVPTNACSSGRPTALSGAYRFAWI